MVFTSASVLELQQAVVGRQREELGEVLAQRDALEHRAGLVRPALLPDLVADLDELYRKNDRQHRAIREAMTALSPQGARVLAREHVLSSGRLLEAILDKVAAQTRDPSSVAPDVGVRL